MYITFTVIYKYYVPRLTLGWENKLYIPSKFGDKK